MHSSSVLTLASVPLLAALHAAFSRLVPEPYMDEPFHVKQTQAYCAGHFSTWDEKITTFPGLYALGTGAAWLAALPGGSAEDVCTLSLLRAVNLAPALLTLPLLLKLLERLHPRTSRADLLGNAVMLSLLPTHFFYHFLYYTDSAATCSALLLLLLVLPAADGQAAQQSQPPQPSQPSQPSRPSLARVTGAGLAAALCLSLRQTNAVWIAFALGCDALHQLHAAGSLPAQLPLTAALAKLPAALLSPAAAQPGGRRGLHALLLRWPPLLALLAGFAAFVRVNGGVVLGDKSHHTPVAHLAQLLYLTAFATAPFELDALTLRLPATLRAAAAATVSAPLGAAAAAAAALLAAWCTYSHPFLLADNRHLTFYLWRHVLGRHWAARYALVPAHLLLARLLYPPLWRRYGALRSVGLLGCAALVLVPSPLLELRYLTLPALVLRLHCAPLAGARRWGPPLLAFGAVNAALLYVFLARPFAWPDGSTARFMF